MSEKYAIVGLGNPGEKYRYTRHNLGFLVAERLGEQLKWKFTNSSVTKAVAARGEVGEKQVTLFLPLTFMNNSGTAVKQLVESSALEYDRLLVVTDDFNLAFGQLRIRSGGSDGGHNGLESVIRLLGTDQFPRLRLGVGQPRHQQDVADYVLDEFSKAEKKGLSEFVQRSADCCMLWLSEGIEQAMNQFNRRKDDE